ncbi:MAG: hypothetical protein NC820_07515, partial [Candidatus Omnitrophica bacterium]|nr:hypothetical protein [Candidatus Omnitrophota bacterium]
QDMKAGIYSITTQAVGKNLRGILESWRRRKNLSSLNEAAKSLYEQIRKYKKAANFSSSPITQNFWPDILKDNLNIFKEKIREISPTEASRGGYEPIPIKVKWEDLVFIDKIRIKNKPKDFVSKYRHKLWESNFVIKHSPPNRLVAHLIGERIFRLMGIPTTESHLISDGFRQYIIMPFLEGYIGFESDFNNRASF